jgi:thiopeptide-type bacteriocin biosynthesis protein
MSADQLATTPTYHVAIGVLAALAGGAVPQIAAQIGLAPEELDDAIRVYQAAGYSALERRAEREWYQVRIKFRDWKAAEELGARELRPRLDHLEESGAIGGWWFLRKYPCWRVRVRGTASGTPASAVTRVLNELLNAGFVELWWPSIYEPEIAAFGGGLGMNAAHELFCADSRGVLEYALCAAPGLGRRELSILLCGAMMRAAGLDWFECGDVFDRVTRLRPPPATADAAQIEKLAVSVHTLLSISARPDTALFAPRGPAEHAQPWLSAFEKAGRILGEAATSGALERGVRVIFTHVLICHWNRLGLSATTQGILSRAATLAILPQS